MAGMGTLIIPCSQEWRREEFRGVVRGSEDGNQSGETKKGESGEEKVGAGNKAMGEHRDEGGEEVEGGERRGGRGKSGIVDGNRK